MSKFTRPANNATPGLLHTKGVRRDTVQTLPATEYPANPMEQVTIVQPEASNLENTTYQTALAELEYLTNYLDIIAELKTREKTIASRKKELVKFIESLEKLDSIQQESLEEILEQIPPVAPESIPTAKVKETAPNLGDFKL